MRQLVALHKHPKVRRPAWSPEAYIYLNPEKKVYFSGTTAPFIQTIDDMQAVDFEEWKAPVKKVAERRQVRVGGEFTPFFEDANVETRLLTRADLAVAVRNAARKHSIVGVNEIATELGLPE